MRCHAKADQEGQHKEKALFELFDREDEYFADEYFVVIAGECQQHTVLTAEIEHLHHARRATDYAEELGDEKHGRQQVAAQVELIGAPQIVKQEKQTCGNGGYAHATQEKAESDGFFVALAYGTPFVPRLQEE
jgi:hypothetical protein